MTLEICSDVIFLQKRFKSSEDFVIINSFSVDNLVVTSNEKIVGVFGILELVFDPLPCPSSDFFIFCGFKILKKILH